MAARQKSPQRDDTGVFLAIVGVLAVPLVYVLQANGVITIPGMPSLLMYVAIIILFTWAYCRWRTPSTWNPVKRWLTLLVLVFALAVLSYFGVSKQYGRDHSLESSAEQAKIALFEMRTFTGMPEITFTHFNIYYRNVGSLPARAVGSKTTITVGPQPMSQKEIQEAQDKVLSWQGWQSYLRTRKNQDLQPGVGQWFSFPDQIGRASRDLAGKLPFVFTQHWYVYAMVAFKYWDSSMEPDVFGVTEGCVGLWGDLTTNHNCGRSRTFLEREAFTHSSITAQ